MIRDLQTPDIERDTYSYCIYVRSLFFIEYTQPFDDRYLLGSTCGSHKLDLGRLVSLQVADSANLHKLRVQYEHSVPCLTQAATVRDLPCSTRPQCMRSGSFNIVVHSVLESEKINVSYVRITMHNGPSRDHIKRIRTYACVCVRIRMHFYIT